MAVAIRGTPLSVISTANPIAGTLSGARQPQAGDTLVIIHGNDFYAASNMPTPTVGGSTTGVSFEVGADAGTNHAHIKAYTFKVGSTGDLAISVTETGAGDEDKCLDVYVLSGADATTSTDGTAANFNTSATTVHDAPSVSPSTSNAYLICHDNAGGGSSAPSYTPPSGMTEQYDAQAGGISHTGATLQLSASGATGVKTFTPAGSVEYATISVAIRTASGGTTVNATVSFGSAPALTASGTVVQPAAVSFGASPTLTAGATIVKPAAVSFGSAPTLTAAGTIVKLGAVSFGSAPTLTAAGLAVAVAAVAFGAAPTLGLAAFVQRFAAVAFGSAPTLLASGSVGPIVPYVTAVLTPGGAGQAVLTPGGAGQAVLTPGALGTATLTPGGL